LEDSTTLSYGHQVAEELGDLGGPQDSRRQGYLVHSVLLVDAHSERIEGLVDQVRWCRERRKRGQRHQRRARAYEEKESYKWEQASVRMVARLGPKMQDVISVCDREADVYEYLRYKVTEQQRYLVRSSWNRHTADAHGDVRSSARQLPCLGTYEVMVAQKGGRRGRRAEVTLKAGAVFAPLFSAFGPDPIRQRLEIGEGRVLVTTSSLYRKKVAAIRAELPTLEHVLIVPDETNPAAVEGTLDLPEGLDAKYSVILFYRGHW